ncbi:MAG: DUF2306 domain-containing protein [Gammaproteobacteria bacterium]
MRNAQLVLSVLVGFLALVGIGATIRFMLVGGANEGFEQYPNTTLAHVAPGLLYLVLAPLQFIKSIRSKYPVFHRWSGRLLVVVSLFLGASAVFIGVVFPYSGVPEQIVIAIFGTFFLAAAVKGFFCARNKNFRAHREWMMRSFAIGLAIVTMRLIFVPILIMIGSPTMEDAQFWSIASFTLAFILHGIVAELWIRRTRAA